MDDPLEQRMAAVPWRYADRDPVALAALEDRLAAVAAAGKLIFYNELIAGIAFRIPGVRGGAPFQIVSFAWSSFDRLLVNEFLAMIGLRSYRRGGFMANALVVDRSEDRPGEHFVRWLRQIRVRPRLTDAMARDIWRAEVAGAHAWHAPREPGV